MVSWEAKGFNYQSFLYALKSFLIASHLATYASITLKDNHIFYFLVLPGTYEHWLDVGQALNVKISSNITQNIELKMIPDVDPLRVRKYDTGISGLLNKWQTQ